MAKLPRVVSAMTLLALLLLVTPLLAAPTIADLGYVSGRHQYQITFHDTENYTEQFEYLQRYLSYPFDCDVEMDDIGTVIISLGEGSACRVVYGRYDKMTRRYTYPLTTAPVFY